MARRSHKTEPQLPTDELAPIGVCIRCGRGDDAFLGEVTRDRFGWWMHESCRHWTEVEIEQAQGR